MAEEGFLLGESYLDEIDRVIDAIRTEDYESSVYDETEDSDGMWVRLTAEGDDSIVISDFGEPFPYKAERVVFNPTTHAWEVTDPVYTFDPDAASSGTNIDSYVYELSGTIGLVGQVHRIHLQAFKTGEGDLYWAFSVNGDTQFAQIIANETAGSITYSANQLDENLASTGKTYGIEYPFLEELNDDANVPAGKIVQVMKKRDKFYFQNSSAVESGLARITGVGACAAGSYVAENLDKDLLAIPNEEFGVDLPCLKEVLSREHLELLDTAGSTNGEIVMWIKKGDQYYFRWDDPRLVMGPTPSPVENDSGNFEPLKTSGNETGGIIRNFNPTTGKYEYSRLISIGPAATPSPDPGYDPAEEGVVRGLKITAVDAYNFKIELVDGNGEATITPSGPSPDPVIPKKPTFCTELVFNSNTRLLTATTKRVEDDAVICVSTTKIPCCDGGGGGGDDPYDPPNDPPDDPDDPYEDPDNPYEDPCTPPDFQCAAKQDICYPVAYNLEVVAMSIISNNAANRWTVALVSVIGQVGDITSRFSLEGRSLKYASNEELPEGEYEVVFSITNTSSAPCDQWTESNVYCSFDVISCYCDDNYDTEEDPATDNCPVACSSYSFTPDGPLEVVINTRRPEDSADTVDLEFKAPGFKMGPYLDTNNKLAEIERDVNGNTEVKRAVQPKNYTSYRFQANIDFSVKGHDADKSWRWEEDVIVKRVDKNDRPRTNRTGSRQYKGYIRAMYIGNTDPNRRSFRATFYFQGRTYSVGANSNVAEPVVTKEFPSSYAYGTITQTLTNKTDTDEDPTEKDENIVGVVRVSNQCPEDDWCFAITGSTPAGEAAKFGVKKIDRNAALIYAKTGVNIALATRDLDIDATFCGDASAYPTPASPLCVLNGTFTIPAASVFEDLEVTDATGVVDTGVNNVEARGVAGEPIAKLGAQIGGNRVNVPDGQRVEWKVLSATNPDTGLPFPDSVTQPFQVDNVNAEAYLTAAYDLKVGTYNVKVAVQNRQMMNDGETLEKEFTVNIAKTNDKFKPSELIG